MNGHDSAYAVLGLRPGARPADVDEAYRRLIKQYHPDMQGGNSSRAAEINRAYTQLRRQGAATSLHPPRRVPVPVIRPLRPRGWRTGWALIGAVAIASAVALANDVPSRGGSGRAAYTVPVQWQASSDPPADSAAVSPLANFEEPLQTAVIDRAIEDAVKFHVQGDSAAAVEYSRACQERLHKDPNLAWFDSCAAFDEATVTLAEESSITQAGPFNPSSVIARQMGAARLISADTLGADSRLRQIRTRVELVLVPRMDEAAAQQP